MNTYLLLFVVALTSSLVLTPLTRRLCERLGWIDSARGDRHIHQKPIPRLGGIAIFLSVGLALLPLLFLKNLVTQSIAQTRTQILALAIPAAIIFLFGVFDDLFGAKAPLKFLALGFAGLIFYLLGGRIDGISVPFVGSVQLPWYIGLALTLVWTVGVANAFNLIDGVDGLATGAALFASVVMLVIALVNQHALVTVISLVFAGALIGFLRYNFNPASIFLGDSGSLFIGFSFAALSVLGTQKASTAVAVAIPLMAFGLPIVDTGFTLVRRFIGGKPLFQGDREHIHHMLLDRGWSQRRVALVLYSVCALFGLCALLFVRETGNGRTGLILLIVSAAVILAVGRLQYHEVEELKASLRRNLPERRKRAANNIAIRRATRLMSRASTVSEVFRAVESMLKIETFVYCTVQLGIGGDVERNQRAFNREKPKYGIDRCEFRGGMICWSWERGDIPEASIVGSGAFWTLRLPLASDRFGVGYINLYREFNEEALLLDVNYLLGLFRREMASACERILLMDEKSETKPITLQTASVFSND